MFNLIPKMTYFTQYKSCSSLLSESWLVGFWGATEPLTLTSKSQSKPESQHFFRGISANPSEVLFLKKNGRRIIAAPERRFQSHLKKAIKSLENDANIFLIIFEIKSNKRKKIFSQTKSSWKLSHFLFIFLLKPQCKKWNIWSISKLSVICNI